MLAQDSSIDEARIAEENFEWLRASELYLKNLAAKFDATSEFPSAQYVRIINCLVRASFQSNDPIEFRGRIESAMELCGKASLLLEKAPAKMSSYFKGRSLLLKSWIAEDPASRIEALDECLKVVTESIETVQFENPEEQDLNYSLLFLHCLEELWVSETSAEKLDQIITNGIQIGRKIADGLDVNGLEKNNLLLLAETYCLTAWFCGLGVFFYESFDKRSELRSLRDGYWTKFDSLSNILRDPVTIAKSLIYRQEDYDTRIVRERALEFLPKIFPTRDNLLIAGLYSQISPAEVFLADWEDPRKTQEVEAGVQRNLGEAKARYLLIRPVGIHWECLSYSFEILGAWRLQCSCSPSAIYPNDRRREMVTEGFEISKSGYEKLKGYSHRAAIHLASNLGYSMYLKARLLQDMESKRRSFEGANNFSRTAVELEAIVEPHRDWDFGMMLAGLADIQSNLALLEDDREKKIMMIKDAIETYTKASSHISLAHGEIRDPNADLGDRGPWLQEGLQEMLRELYEATGDESALVKRLEILQQEKRIFEQVEMAGVVASIEWRIGFVHSLLGDHLSASKSYCLSSDFFNRASKSIGERHDYYLEFANYMKAWGEIENARFAHYQEDYLVAGHYFERAKDLLEVSKRFADFAPHYEAWSHLEIAENLSRTDTLSDIKRSIAEFENASGLFSKSDEEIRRKISLSMYGLDFESPQFIALASSFRREYCQGRIAVEEARLLYRNGQKLPSLDGYILALGFFEKLSKKCGSVSESKEIRAITFSCRAWVKVLEAEIYASPSLYDEAAELFLKVRNLAVRNKASFVSEGNSKYCTALKSILEFKRGSRIEDYVSAKASLGEASIAYTNAGFKHPVGWINATERMIDAFVYVNSALKESNPQIKAKNFAAAERLLSMAATIFEADGYSSRKSEVEGLKRKMKEEKELALSLIEIFGTPSILSSTESFHVPQPAPDAPMGNLQNLQSAVHMVVSVPNNFVVNEDFDVRIDLINTGRELVFPHKIEEFIPENFQFERDETSSSKDYEIDENSPRGRLVLFGKGLSPFSVRSVSFKLRARETSVSEVFLNPKVFYSNGNGELFEKTTSARSLVSTNFPLEFRFDEPGSAGIFRYLTKAFIDDYMVAKSPTDLSGWRTLPLIIREGKVPAFSVYNRNGGVSPEIGELTKRGLIEKRTSTRQRGRGGEVLRIRIAYDRDAIKSYVSERIRNRNQSRKRESPNQGPHERERFR